MFAAETNTLVLLAVHVGLYNGTESQWERVLTTRGLTLSYRTIIYINITVATMEGNEEKTMRERKRDNETVKKINTPKGVTVRLPSGARSPPILFL